MDDIDVAINAADYEIATGKPVAFKIFTGLLKATRSADGKMRLHGVASSSITDRHGDRMELSALQDMQRAAEQNLTIFLNHSYNVPEDVAGSVEKAMLVDRGVDGEGNALWDLEFDVLINSANPRAVDAFNAIDNGTKLGLSIGAMIPEGGALRNKKTGAYVFLHVDLLETSIVGIPANPRSWVSYAVKALKSSTTMPLGTPTLTLDNGHYKIEGEIEGLQFAAPPAVQKDDEPDETPEPEEVEESTDPEVTEAAACGAECDGGTCSKPKGHDGPHSASKDTEPDAEATAEPDESKAKIRIIEVDTGDGGSQEADSSNPGNEQADDDSEYDSAPDADVTASAELTEALVGTVTTLALARDLLARAIGERDEARRERDEANKSATMALEGVSQIIQRLASMPVGRKAVIREAQAELAGLERIYSPEVLQKIRGN